LTAHGRVVTSYLVGEFRDANAAVPESHQKRKESPINRDTRFRKKKIVSLWAVKHAQEVQHCGSDDVNIMCILHLYKLRSRHHIECMIHSFKVLVIIGSVRVTRIGDQIAAWVAGIGRTQVEANFEVIDLRDWPLPMEGEPGIPAIINYTSKHTQSWSEKIAEADAFVFVSPQYNWGYPAPLKNALDHLYREWNGKPAVIVTYGGHGGGKCAAQLQQVLEGGFKMKPILTMPELTLTRARIEADTGEIDADHELAGQVPVLRKAFSELANALLSRRTSNNKDTP
jgi:NAD(P)H-dependent FMN reductase